MYHDSLLCHRLPSPRHLSPQRLPSLLSGLNIAEHATLGLGVRIWLGRICNYAQLLDREFSPARFHPDEWLKRYPQLDARCSRSIDARRLPEAGSSIILPWAVADDVKTLAHIALENLLWLARFLSLGLGLLLLHRGTEGCLGPAYATLQVS